MPRLRKKHHHVKGFKVMDLLDANSLAVLKKIKG